MTRRVYLVVAVLLFGWQAIGTAAETAAAGEAAIRAADGALAQVLQRGGITLDEAVALVQARYDAKVVKAETVEQRGRTVHRIRLLSADGRVWTVSVDAQSGELR
ncbi:MAG TPA: PepSY domain-containing protein [Steroidobacteraceae bacterium]|nr:PepSY domain-containing protein [Steroidobacteraceae bacterium]